MVGTYGDEMVHQGNSPNSFTFSYPPGIFSFLDRMDRNSICDCLDQSRLFPRYQYTETDRQSFTPPYPQEDSQSSPTV